MNLKSGVITGIELLKIQKNTDGYAERLKNYIPQTPLYILRS